jgi:hypothetical protein
MMMQYIELLDPSIYPDPIVARFIELLLEPEVDTASTVQLHLLQKTMTSLDDIKTSAEWILAEAKLKIKNGDSVLPHFILFGENQSRMRLEMDEQSLKKPLNLESYLAAGKCMAFIRNAHSVFFRTAIPLINDMPAFGPDARHAPDWGLIVLGSTLRGNCLVYLNKVANDGNSVFFPILHAIVAREGNYVQYPMNRFYFIENSKEMSLVIKQIPKLMAQNKLDERQTIINFATTLKALKAFNYPIN